MVFPLLPIIPGIIGIGLAATKVAARSSAAATTVAGAVGAAAAKAADAINDTDATITSSKKVANEPENLPITRYTLEEKIDIVQSNIANIRKLSGLQTIQFAKTLQITKQALNNWETKKNKINFAQFILLTNVFQMFVRFYSKFPSIKCDEKTFKVIVFIIVYPEYYSKEEFKKYQETITALADLSRNHTQVSSIFKSLIKELPDDIPEGLTII